MKFCSACGGPVELKIPEGDDKPRYVCQSCSTIHYSNPRMVAGVIPLWQGKILICKRAIEPALGTWTLPAGYLENGESVRACAIRETREEAGAELTEITPYAMINLPFIDQVYFMYRAMLQDTNFQPGFESSELKLVSPEDIPWQQLSFASIREVLKHYCDDLKTNQFPFREFSIKPEHQY